MKGVQRRVRGSATTVPMHARTGATNPQAQALARTHTRGGRAETESDRRAAHAPCGCPLPRSTWPLPGCTRHPRTCPLQQQVAGSSSSSSSAAGVRAAGSGRESSRGAVSRHSRHGCCRRCHRAAAAGKPPFGCWLALHHETRVCARLRAPARAIGCPLTAESVSAGRAPRCCACTHRQLRQLPPRMMLRTAAPRAARASWLRCCQQKRGWSRVVGRTAGGQGTGRRSGRTH